MIAYRCEKDQRNGYRWNPYTVSVMDNGTITSLKVKFPGYFRSNSTFNRPVNIGSNVGDATNMFEMCYNFNSPVQVGAENCQSMFDRCNNLNQNVQILEGVLYCTNMFRNCNNLNQNIKIPNGVLDCAAMFDNCINLRQQIEIPDTVQNCFRMFRNTRVSGNIKMSENATDCREMFFSSPSYLAFVNLFIPRSVTNVAGMLATESGTSGYYKEINVYINGNEYRKLNILSMFGGSTKSTLYSNSFYNGNRKNIFFNAALNNVFNNTKNSIVGYNNNTAMISWTSMTNGFYNKTYNIYCYYNYSG